ncbi:MAG: hypothetical protein RG740_00045 [Acholeplasmataceae bacterium]|jgi:flagellar biosynthesis component FlhA|nr:hypothetical protein [Acholeplasmataceae bacterium]
MKNQSKKFFRDVKKQADKAVDEVKQYTADTKELIEVYQAFKKASIKIKKVTSNFINLDLPIYGILDKDFETLTFRTKDTLEVDQVLQTGKHTLKVISIGEEIVEVPLMVNDVEHKVECKVATLKKV